jgi:hypothetical protein
MQIFKIMINKPFHLKLQNDVVVHECQMAHRSFEESDVPPQLSQGTVSRIICTLYQKTEQIRI